MSALTVMLRALMREETRAQKHRVPAILLAQRIHTLVQVRKPLHTDSFPKEIELAVVGLGKFKQVIPSIGSCQVRYVSLAVTMILRIVTQHDREGREAWSYARPERDILTREDKKDQNDLILAYDCDPLSDPGAYFSSDLASQLP